MTLSLIEARRDYWPVDVVGVKALPTIHLRASHCNLSGNILVVGDVFTQMDLDFLADSLENFIHEEIDEEGPKQSLGLPLAVRDRLLLVWRQRRPRRNRDTVNTPGDLHAVPGTNVVLR